ncbi:MAG: DinB family protein [Candidatus Cryptobacteroides sp.]|nr:DinB family protein [Bacteroidales bacterium]
MDIYSKVTDEILAIVNIEEPILRSLSEDVITTRFNHQNRSIKMLLGHLVDSASNNQQRMVRLQYAPRVGHCIPDGERGLLVFPDYTQDNDLWIHLQDYQREDWDTLVSLWKFFNLHVAHIINAVDRTKLSSYWLDYEGHQVTLNDMILGYTDHLRLHIGQIHELMEIDINTLG